MSTLSKRDGESGGTEEWLSLAQAATALGISSFSVLSRALDGDLTAQKFGGRWFFTRASVDRALSPAVPA